MASEARDGPGGRQSTYMRVYQGIKFPIRARDHVPCLSRSHHTVSAHVGHFTGEVYDKNMHATTHSQQQRAPLRQQQHPLRDPAASNCESSLRVLLRGDCVVDRARRRPHTSAAAGGGARRERRDELAAAPDMYPYTRTGEHTQRALRGPRRPAAGDATTIYYTRHPYPGTGTRFVAGWVNNGRYWLGFKILKSIYKYQKLPQSTTLRAT